MGEGSHASLLHRISRIISSSLPLERVLRELIALVSEVTACDACLVYLADPSGRGVVLRASQLPHPEIGRLWLKPGEGVAGWVAAHQSAVSLPRGAYLDPRFKKFTSLVEDTYEALLSAPLVSGGAAIGVINVHHTASRAHSPEEIAMITFLGEQLGGAIEKARLAEENARLQRELEARKLIERAKGILQRDLNLSEEEAYLRLRNESRRQRRPMSELAQAIVAGVSGAGSQPAAGS